MNITIIDLPVRSLNIYIDIITDWQSSEFHTIYPYKYHICNFREVLNLSDQQTQDILTLSEHVYRLYMSRNQ